MRVWFTRPSTWDLQVKGIGRCEMWLRKPFFDRSPRGEERDPLYPYLPIGWRVVDPKYGDVTEQFSITVRHALTRGRYEDVAQSLWDALCRSVDGKGPMEGGAAPARWNDLAIDDERERAAMESIVFECDVPPQLWFEAAQHNGWEDQTAAGRWAQQTFEFDMLMGIEPDEPPPPSNPVIDYQHGRFACIASGLTG
jgi:hypothetical protein